jgi:uncharacterized RDD family membrane protein YckC
MKEKYKTVWQRWFAGLLDSLLFLPLGMLNGVIQHKANLPVFAIILWQIFYIFSRPAYTILMHGKYGQTVGKKAMGLILLNIDETRIINYRQAIRRESPELIALLASMIFQINYLLGNNFSPAASTLFLVVGSANTIWFLLEIITTLSNDKRRALHDIIAGSVVVKKDLMFLDRLPEDLEVSKVA